MLRILFCCGLLLSASLAARDFEGVLDWRQRAELGTVIDGMVSRVPVRPGQAVERGALLVELDQRAWQARLAGAKAGVAAAEMHRAEALRELERTLELYDRTLLSDHERKQAEIAAKAAEAELLMAEAELSRTRLQRDYSRIIAPFSGVVTAVKVQPGEALVNRLQARPVVTLVDVSAMRALAEVDLNTAASLQAGMAVKVGVRQQWLDAEVAYVGLEPIEETTGNRSYRLEVELVPPPSMSLRGGENVVVRIDE